MTATINAENTFRYISELELAPPTITIQSILDSITHPTCKAVVLRRHQFMVDSTASRNDADKFVEEILVNMPEYFESGRALDTFKNFFNNK
jgi:hypothetical protein